MQDTRSIIAAAEAVGKGLEAEYKAKGATLEDRLKKVGRRLPRKLRADAQAVAQAEKLARNRPDLAQSAGPIAARAAKVTAGLQAQDRKAERRKALKVWAMGLGVNLFLAMGLIVAWWAYMNAGS